MSWETEVIVGKEQEFPEAMVAVRMATGERVRYVPERTCNWTGTVGCGLADGPYDEEEDACISFAVVKHFLDCGHCSITESTSPPNYCPNCGAKVIGG